MADEPGFLPRLRQQPGVVQLALIGDDVRVRPGRCHQVVVADELADPGPRHPAHVEQADAAVAQIVRAESGDAGRGTGTGDRGAEAIAAEAMEDGRSGTRSSRGTSRVTASKESNLPANSAFSALR